MPLAPLDGVVDTGLLERGRPILVLDPAGFLGRLGLPGPALECAPLQGRMLSAVPIAGDDGADALLLVVIDDPAPEPGVFGPLETLAAHASGVLRRARLHDDLEGAYLATVTALANALEAKDVDTHDHATETSHLAVAVGLVAIVLAAVNMVGGFVVTDRMLQMFTRKKPAKAAVDAEKVEGR